ncbi:MAG: cache domain-containing protein [Comamonadaceae bacterium]|nr:cache domain-containing protein [Comamonadaceae bacterium]
MGAWVKTQKDIVAALTPAAELDSPQPMLEQALKSGRLDLAYLGSADKRMVSVPERQRPADYDPTARPWYRLAESSDAAVITPPYIGSSSKKLVVSFAMAVKAGGSTRAVAGTDVALDDVIATLKSIKPTPGGFAFLVEPGGRIVAHPDAALTLKPVAELSGRAEPGAAGTRSRRRAGPRADRRGLLRQGHRGAGNGLDAGHRRRARRGAGGARRPARHRGRGDGRGGDGGGAAGGPGDRRDAARPRRRARRDGRDRTPATAT